MRSRPTPRRDAFFHRRARSGSPSNGWTRWAWRSSSRWVRGGGRRGPRGQHVIPPAPDKRATASKEPEANWRCDLKRQCGVRGELEVASAGRVCVIRLTAHTPTPRRSCQPQGDPKAFASYLEQYRNTICGRHPIGVFLNVSWAGGRRGAGRVATAGRVRAAGPGVAWELRLTSTDAKRGYAQGPAAASSPRSCSAAATHQLDQERSRSRTRKVRCERCGRSAVSCFFFHGSRPR